MARADFFNRDGRGWFLQWASLCVAHCEAGPGPPAMSSHFNVVLVSSSSFGVKLR